MVVVLGSRESTYRVRERRHWYWTSFGVGISSNGQVQQLSAVHLVGALQVQGKE